MNYLEKCNNDTPRLLRMVIGSFKTNNKEKSSTIDKQFLFYSRKTMDAMYISEYLIPCDFFLFANLGEN